MNDHNLDDLIIDTIAPKNNKTKSLLTIIALLIVILIVGIILIKTLLKSPEDNALTFEENLSERLIAPELQLQTKKQEPRDISKPKDDPSLSLIAQEEVSTIDEAKRPSTEAIEKTIEKGDVTQPLVEEVIPKKEIKKPVVQNPAIKAPVVEKPTTVKPVIQNPAIAEKQIIKKPDTKKPIVKKPVTNQPTTRSNKSVAGKYYVQVGSFKENPSPRFLSVIKSSGFKYLVSKPDATGNKKLLIGPYNSRKEVDKAREIVRDRIHKSAFVVQK